MAKSVVQVKLITDAKPFNAGMKDAQKGIQGFDLSVNKLLKGALVTGLAMKGVQAVKDFVGDSVRAFSDLEQSVGGTEAVFGDSSDAIDKFARTSAQAIGLSEAQFRTATTGIGGQLKRMTGDVDYAADHAVLLTQVGADLAATYGGTTAEAVQALGAAFRGEADPAERFNLNLKIGAVNAKAVEMGLAKSTAAVDDHARAQATVALIMEQSADAQGQFAREADTVAGKQERLNAELEDQKALIGQQLAPMWLSLMELGGNLLPLVGQLAEAFGWLTGSISDSDKALSDFQRVTGKDAPDSLKDLAVIIKEVEDNATGLAAFLTHSGNWRTGRIDDFKAGLEELFATIDDPALLTELRARLDEVAEVLKLDTAETEALAEAVERELSRKMADSADRVLKGKYIPAVEDAAEANEELAGSIDEVVAAQRAATDPVAGAIRGMRNLEEATKAYNDALVAHGPASQEAQDAALDLLDAQNGLDAALAEIAEKGGPQWREEFRRVARQAGLADEQIDEMIKSVEKADGMSATVHLRTSITAPNLRYKTDSQGNATPIFTNTKPQLFAKGGIVTGPTNALIGEAGSDEAVIPLDKRGERFMRDALGGGAGASGVTINVTALDPAGAARAVVQALQEYERRHGPIPVNVGPR